MNVKIVTTCMFLSSIALNGCGFKSGLSMPNSDDESGLFVSDAEAIMQNGEQTPTESIDGEFAVPAAALPGIDLTNEIMLDRITVEAIDASILTEPNAGRVGATGAGVVIDLTEVEESVKKQRNSQ